MGKSRHIKWYDKNSDEVEDNHIQAEEFRDRRAKRLRTITDKHESVTDQEDREFGDD
jgi:hypothetical protein